MRCLLLQVPPFFFVSPCWCGVVDHSVATERLNVCSSRFSLLRVGCFLAVMYKKKLWGEVTRHILFFVTLILVCVWTCVSICSLLSFPPFHFFPRSSRAVAVVDTTFYFFSLPLFKNPCLPPYGATTFRMCVVSLCISHNVSPITFLCGGGGSMCAFACEESGMREKKERERGEKESNRKNWREDVCCCCVFFFSAFFFYGLFVPQRVCLGIFLLPLRRFPCPFSCSLTSLSLSLSLPLPLAFFISCILLVLASFLF